MIGKTWGTSNKDFVNKYLNNITMLGYCTDKKSFFFRYVKQTKNSDNMNMWISGPILWYQNNDITPTTLFDYEHHNIQ